MATAGEARFDVRINQEGLNKDLALSSKKISQLTEQFNKQVISIKKQSAAIDDLQRKLAAITTMEKQVASITAMESQLKRVTAETANITKQNQDLIAQYDRAVQLANSMQAAGFTPEQMTQAVSEIDRLAALLQPVWQALDESEKRAQELRDRIAELKLDPANSAEAKNLADKIAIASEQLELSKAKANELKNTLQRAFVEPSNEAERASSNINKLGNALMQAAQYALNLGVNIGKSIGSKILSGFRRLTSFVRNLLPHTNKVSNGFVRLADRIGKLILAAFVFNVIRRGLSELREYLGGLLRTNEQFVRSLNQIKVNLMTAFQPIYDAILPALNNLMEWLAKATHYVAVFTSALFGKTYQQSKDAAQAINEQSEAMKNLDKSNKKAGKSLANFDVINQQAIQTAEESETSKLFEETPTIDADPAVLTWIDELSRKLKELIPDLDYFYNLGQNLAQKIIDALNSIDWEFIKAWAESFAMKLAAFLNGFLVNPSLWIAIGKTIAEGFNTILTFVNAFITTFDWLGLARALGAGINSLVNTIDWDLLSRTIYNGVNALFGFIYEFFTTVDWKNIGSKLAKGLNDIITGIDWKLMGKALASGLNAAIDLLFDFVTKFDWKKFGISLSNSINGFFNEIDWAKAGQTISKSISGILDFLIETIQNIDWKQVGESIHTFLVNIDWEGIISKIVELIAVAAAGLGLLIWNAIKPEFDIFGDEVRADMEENGTSAIESFYKAYLKRLASPFAGLENAINDFLASFWGKILNAEMQVPAKSSGESIVDGFVEGLKKPFDPLQRFKEFIQGVKDLFGIQSPSTVFAEIGKNIMQGLLNGITSLTKNAINFFKDLVKNIKSTFSDIPNFVKNTFNDAWNNVKTIWNNAPSWFNEKLQSILNYFKEKWNNIKISANDAWNNVKTIWNNAPSWFNTIASSISNYFNNLWNGIQRGAQTMQDGFRRVFDGLVNIVRSPINQIIDFVNRMIRGVTDGINSVIRAANKIGSINISTISAPSIPRLATGGVVGHGIYELGENGAEAIVPLENNTGWINKVAAQMASQLENFSINPTITNNLVERGRQQQTYTPFVAGSMDWIDDLADAIVSGLSGIQTTGTSQAQTNVTVELDGREVGRMILPYTQEEQTRLGGRISNRRLATT